MTIEQIRTLTRDAQQAQLDKKQQAQHEEQDALRQRYREERTLLEQRIRDAALLGRQYYETIVPKGNLLSYLSQHFGKEGYQIEIDETIDGSDLLRLKW